MRTDTPSAGGSIRPDLVLPTFLVIGAMRSGTTALSAYLRAHPEVFVSRQKELNFFDTYFDRGIEWYAKWFEDAKGFAAVGEATPSYMYAEEAGARMGSVLPDAKLVVMLRNPVDRAYSHFWLNRSRGLEDLEFAQAIEAEPRRLAEGGWKARFGKSYLDRGRYLPQLRRVCEYYPRSALHVALFEDLSREPLTTFASICRFIGVDDTVVPPRLGQAQGGYRVHRSKLLHRASKRFPETMRRTVRKWNSRPSSYPAMDADIRAELLSRFARENKALEVWLGMDLSAWQS